MQKADIVDAGGLRFPAVVPLLSDALWKDSREAMRGSDLGEA